MQKILIFGIIIIALLSFQNLHSQNFLVSDYGDESDFDIDDGIYAPPTLRSAIQNANKNGVAAVIKFLDNNATIQVVAPLPVINVPIKIEGSGLTLERIGFATYGLWITKDGSELRDIKVQGFNGAGIHWQGSDGIIENVTSRDNNGAGLNLNNAHRNTIGSSSTGYFSNVFSGATGTGGYGVSLLNSNDNVIQYCGIGVDAGSQKFANSRSGINIDSSYRNIIQNNTISGNDWHGIQIYCKGNDCSNIIENNMIGLEIFGQDSIPNKMSGILLNGTKGDTIRNNHISGNLSYGVHISTANCSNITVENNIIGTDKSTKNALPNAHGIQMSGSHNTIKNNIISGNNGNGIAFSSGANNITEIKGNIIGLDSGLTLAVPNNRGAFLAGQDIIFGDPDGIDFNYIAGNKSDGIFITGSTTNNIRIVRNIIGTNSIFPTAVFQNGGSGILVTYAAKNVKIDSNLVVACQKNGIEVVRIEFNFEGIPPIFHRPNFVLIRGNSIGPRIDLGDSSRIGGSGISVFAADSVLIEDNQIFGTNQNGITIGIQNPVYNADTTLKVRIFSNMIGDSSLTQHNKIDGDGIAVLNSGQIFIGGTGRGNMISNSDGSGINMLRAEYIYIDSNSIFAIKNHGIHIDSSDIIEINRNTIGPDSNLNQLKIVKDGIRMNDCQDVFVGSQNSTELANKIFYCQNGISVRGQSLRAYSYFNVFKNNELGGIELDDLVSYFNDGKYNDYMDLDSGSNQLQNTIDVEQAYAEGDSIVIKGHFNGAAFKLYKSEIYLTTAPPDSLKHTTQGLIPVEILNFETDEDGYAFIDTTFKNPLYAALISSYDFPTVIVHGENGTSSFSHLSYINPIIPFVDIEVIIDSVMSGVDEYGIVELYTKVKNIGIITALDVVIRDSVSNLQMKEASISNGIADVTDGAFIGLVSELQPGDSVIFVSKGKLMGVGEHTRIVSAFAEQNEPDTLNNSDTITFNVNPVKHNLSLNQGWNMISSYVEPTEAELEDIFAIIENFVVILKNNLGQIFFPSFGINDIGFWNALEGYQIYMSEAKTLEISGFKILPQSSPINLVAGWNMISYLRDSSMDIEAAFSTLNINDNLIIAKDNFGQVYFPIFGINTIGNLMPGQGYQLYLNQNTTLSYPDN
ncbi:MAG: right-handed parallel beta-helix repeat-containing protein [Candidatus Kapabacteria bacterium]|nr:right-handed parallel beta-helix repeat-containing protein [Candidatus Kapabacteria bacterium]